MQHLVSQTLPRIEDNLIWVRNVRDSVVSWWFNIILLLVVVGSFVYFLVSSYGSAVPDELQSIPFEPRTWNNAVRNVPITQYGQIPQVEAGGDIQGFTRKTSVGEF